MLSKLASSTVIGVSSMWSHKVVAIICLIPMIAENACFENYMYHVEITSQYTYPTYIHNT